MSGNGIIQDLRERFGEAIGPEQTTRDAMPTVWVDAARIQDVLRYLKTDASQPYNVLYDITAIDEHTRANRADQPPSDFSVVYTLMSFERNSDLRLKAALRDDALSIPTATGIWAMADWYECETYDMFGIKFDGHPHLRRLLMPKSWPGYPLRKEHHARATECDPYTLTDEKQDFELEQLQFNPEEWGFARRSEDSDYMFLNLGPHHPGTHGIIRFVLQLDGETIENCAMDIGYHHRGAEKMAERQSWHSFIPYTDRIDYVGGVMNNLAYLLGVEQLAGIQVPARAQVIRVMMSELFRIISHLVWYGTFAQDIGAMSPVLYLFNDREKAFEIVEAITGGRMHPSWFRIGGVAHDLPRGWDEKMRAFLKYLPPRLADLDKALMANAIFRARTVDIGKYTTAEALDWGVTGPGLRATGLEWDFRKKRPYSGYENFEFDIPVFQNGDVYDRARVHIEEMRQSLRIIEQCVNNMPEGPYKADHPLTTPPPKEKTLKDIETLIDHFLSVSVGPVIPAGEALSNIEAAKGANGYYLVSDANTMAYRNRIRTPSFAHLQMVPFISRGGKISDLLAIIGAVDYVLADLDR